MFSLSNLLAQKQLDALHTIFAFLKSAKICIILPKTQNVLHRFDANGAK